jgi:arabinofuranan 3-O-arabinosyltransferase
MTFAPAAGHHRPPSAQAGGAASAVASTASTSGISGIAETGGRESAWPPRPSRVGLITAVVFVLALGIFLASSSGQVFFDTKLGVDLDPAAFLTRLWHLWNGDEWFGTLQDQYIGYAFPMAPFYLVGQLLQVPVWITERIWLAALTAAGFGGLVRLADALRIGTPRSRIVAGLAFALWPTFTIVIGSTSAGALPGLLVPWAVLPLVRASQGGTLPRAAARSGLAVLFMGGVNATSTLDVLILPAIFIVTGFRGRRRITLAALWAGAVVLATAWWIGPLLLQAKYSFNFLPFIEQSQTTTATMSAASFLRGAGNWTAYLNFGQPWLRAGWAMVAYPVSVLAAATAAATGLLGVARRDLPWAGWLRISLGIAALLALAGYPGPLGGPLHHPVDQLLNGAAAPLRSVYKLEPVAAAVLALGIAHALVLRTRRASIAEDPAPRMLARLVAIPVIGLVLLGLAWPQASGQVLNAGSFSAVPRYWYQAAAYLARHSPRAPALVVPAAAHGAYLWGEPVDDPLEPLASSPWVAQGLVPYGGAGSGLLLRSVDAALNLGERIPGLVATLHRSGIGYVVVRNDLSPSSIGYVPPQVVHRALESSGFHRVAAFGGLVTGAQTDPGAGNLAYALPSYPAVEIFAAGAPGTPPPAAAVALPASRTVLVNGGPDALLQLTGQHVLPAGAPAIIAGDPVPVTPALWAVTDTLRRSDHDFGSIDPTGTYTYTARQDNPPDSPLGSPGGPPRQMLPVGATGHQTVAVLSGAASVTASSAGSWLAETPQIDPVNVFDANPATVWTEANPVTPVGQWVQIRFDHTITLPAGVSVSLLDDSSARPVASRLTVRTDAGTRTTSLRRTGAAQPLRVAPGPTRTLRITIAAVRGGFPGGLGAGLTGVSIPGVTVTRYLQPAQSIAGRNAAAVAFSFQRQVPSPASLANVAAYPPMARRFSTAGPAAYRFSASAIAVPGPALDAILARLTPVRAGALEVTASSTYGSLPSLAPANLFRVRNPGSWIAGGRNAVLNLTWHGARTIRRMTIRSLPGFAAAPKTVKITSPHGVRYASLGLDGLTEIVPPLTTTRMSISFPVLQYATVAQPGSGQPVQLPVGLSGLSIPALNGLQPATLTSSARFSLPCGSGPPVTVDGRSLRTRVSGRVGALISFQPVRVRLCAPTSTITLDAGAHRLLASRPGAFSITDLSLAEPSPAVRSSAGRRVRVLRWQPEYRKLQVSAGSRAYLELHENANPGWVATVNGRPLRAMRLDGWQQGWVLPAGSKGVVILTFGPAKFYHVWIVLSAVGVLGLLAAAVVRRHRSVREPMHRPLVAEHRQAGPPPSPENREPGPPGSRWRAGEREMAEPSRLERSGSGWPGSPGAGRARAGRAARAGFGRWDRGRPAGRPGADKSWPAGRGWEALTRHEPSTSRVNPEPGPPARNAARDWTAFGKDKSAGTAGTAHRRGTPDHADPPGPRPRPSGWRAVSTWAGLGALAALIAVVGGPVVLAVPLAAVLAYHLPRWCGWAAFAAMIAAGVLTALAAHPAQAGTGAFGGPAQACALVALTVALMPALPARRSAP